MDGTELENSAVGSLAVERVVAVEYHRPSDNGRTAPSIITCEQSDAFLVEVVAKFSARCTVQGLAFELLAACLAADLGLPVPEPFVVDIGSDWTATITNNEIRRLIAASAPVAFGSKHIAEGYQGWNPGVMITEMMLSTAARIFLFDGIIQNSDRRVTNPNCKVRGEDLLIFDHELSFRTEGIIGWKAPWQVGGLEHMKVPGNHIFWEQLKGRNIDFPALGAPWKALSDGHLESYLEVQPVEWSAAQGDVKKAIELIKKARDNMDDCLIETKRVLQ